MKWFAEITEYNDAYAGNGVYLLNDSKSKMYAFQPHGTGTIKVFKKPIQIDIRGRKFKVNPVQHRVDVEDEQPEGRVWTVKGSKGDEYKVTELNGNLSCTCSGFKFRGKCKHADSIELAV